MAVNPYSVNHLKAPLKNYEHKGDFTVMTVGTGCPDSIVGRSGPSTLVQYKGHYFLVDVGAGTTLRLVEAGIPLDSIKNILITHMHTDHTEGYIKFMVESWTLGRRAINIFGVEGVKVTTAPAIHAVYNLAYRFDVDGKSIVVSGDTSYSESLIELSKNTDILVIDVGRVVIQGYIGPGEMKMPPRLVKSGPPKPVDPATYVPLEVKGKSHAMLEACSNYAAKANVKKLVLTHYPLFTMDLEATLEQLKMYHKGEVIFGQDLLEIKP